MIHAKKSLGQNFLNSKAVAREIVLAGNLHEGDTVLEIGPGKGFLTEEILKTHAYVIAVEKDDRMIPLLQEKFTIELKEGRLILIHGDIVELLETKSLVFPAHYKLIANIPYYITGYLLRAFLEMDTKPERMILMLQKEVADRIVARDQKESVLSIAVKAYGTPKIIKKVPARYFTPAPKVDSAVLAIENISNKYFTYKNDEIFFFTVVKAGFAHKRKQLFGNLKDVFGEKTLRALDASGILPNVRAEDISLEDWLKLKGELG